MTAGATVSVRDLEFSYPGGNSVLTGINAKHPKKYT